MDGVVNILLLLRSSKMFSLVSYTFLINLTNLQLTVFSVLQVVQSISGHK